MSSIDSDAFTTSSLSAYYSEKTDKNVTRMTDRHRILRSDCAAPWWGIHTMRRISPVIYPRYLQYPRHRLYLKGTLPYLTEASRCNSQ